MPKLQKVSKKVFAEMAETLKKKGAYDDFLDIDKTLGLHETDVLKELKGMYLDLVNQSRNTISTLATLEELIIQIRCKNVVDSELRLSLSRNYIYARSLFYRRGNEINDIRVLVGDTNFYEEFISLDNLLNNPTFREICKTKLLDAMNKEIKSNLMFLNQNVNLT